ncbi:TIGR04053 family radical SAM/SPASM domain-containing protein [Algisphaera agarilytica]|uniref:Radical SAM protein n=1 Tax=Algisphaera agarilytica TaxID=1385975 RepID=A0A7X0LJW2_9BACT|nr:TIGR04053 family radical SAM/SPASM domain-containing protein [Algisphaera agarilytica]MBB6428343.1 radical SAM protein [Algisphaera agarilytica]
MHGRNAPRYALSDAAHSPLLVFYEVTRACDLACRHCRARAMPHAHPHELSTAGSLSLLEDLANFPKPPMLVLTGGDPFARADLFTLIEYAVSLGLHTSLAPSATPRVSGPLLREAQRCGVQRLSISIDSADADWHDRFRGEAGTFNDGLRILRDCQAMGLSTQVNTTVMPGNLDQLTAIADLVESVGAAMWSVFFLVPTGRAYREDRLSGNQTDEVFDLLWRLAKTRPFAIKTTEAPFYRRFVKQRMGDPMRPQPGKADGPRPPARSPLGINDGKGICFISHRGEVQPSGFLPLVAGRFPEQSVVDVYQHHPTFVALRDPEQLKGKCGRCGYKSICGGSRARAYAVSRDYLGEEPDCPYQPDLDPEATPASIPLEIRHV